jgi:hypothetical protein
VRAGKILNPLHIEEDSFSYQRKMGQQKSTDLHVRPIRAHILLCMLACYVEWHMRQRLVPILFDQDDKCQVQAARTSIVTPAQRSPSCELKALTKHIGTVFTPLLLQPIGTPVQVLRDIRGGPIDRTAPHISVAPISIPAA